MGWDVLALFLTRVARPTFVVLAKTLALVSLVPSAKRSLIDPVPLKGARCWSVASFDLHVLSTPPAFVLSQDQTLNLNFKTFKKRSLKLIN